MNKSPKKFETGKSGEANNITTNITMRRVLRAKIGKAAHEEHRSVGNWLGCVIREKINDHFFSDEV